MSPIRFRVVSLLGVEFNPVEIRESRTYRCIGREESARGMLESKTGRERKAGGKNVCARICDRARKERERVGVIGCEKGKCERMRVRGRE